MFIGYDHRLTDEYSLFINLDRLTDEYNLFGDLDGIFISFDRRILLIFV
jgi:hypothetical protein